MGQTLSEPVVEKVCAPCFTFSLMRWLCGFATASRGSDSDHLGSSFGLAESDFRRCRDEPYIVTLDDSVSLTHSAGIGHRSR